MKKILILSAFMLLLGSNSFAQSGIEFSQGSWSEMLARAEKENKLIFMDAYAVWCGPCKMMSRDVFSQKETGDFFNANFINVKMDMEKGEGIDLRKKYKVMAYPTLLFIDKDGEVMHQAVGYHTTDLLIALGETALDPEENFNGIKTRYENGDRSPELLYKYTMAKFDAMDYSYTKLADEYLATQKDWGSEENMDFIFRLTEDPHSKMFDYFFKNRPAFEEKFGKQSVARKVEQVVQSQINAASTDEDLKDIDLLYKKVYPARASEMSARLRMGIYAQREDWQNFAGAAAFYYEKFPAQTWDELNEIAWLFSEMVEGKKNTKLAIHWAKKSIEMDDNYFNNDTLAALYFNLGKKKKALKAARKAILLAQQSGEDYSSTEALIEKIKKK
ncbi:MAG: thioredoxin family protein [Saprospiraceae bacterium]